MCVMTASVHVRVALQLRADNERLRAAAGGRGLKVLLVDSSGSSGTPGAAVEAMGAALHRQVRVFEERLSQMAGMPTHRVGAAGGIRKMLLHHCLQAGRDSTHMYHQFGRLRCGAVQVSPHSCVACDSLCRSRSLRQAHSWTCSGRSRLGRRGQSWQRSSWHTCRCETD